MWPINKEIAAYVRCIKSLWNDYYIALPDGEHDFAEVQRLIWQTLVLKRLEDTYEGGASGQLVLRLHASASEVLLADEDSVAGAVSWREGFALSPGALLQFERFFDFRAWNDPCELKYVLCRLLDEKGQRLLVPTSAADFYYRATPT